jgi:hypothetical protein
VARRLHEAPEIGSGSAAAVHLAAIEHVRERCEPWRMTLADADDAEE